MPKAIFYRKEPNLNSIMPKEEYEILQAVILPDKKFQEFINDPLKGYPWIMKAKSGRTIRKENGDYITQVILVKGETSDYGFLVNSEGYDYPRYIAYVEIHDITPAIGDMREIERIIIGDEEETPNEPGNFQ